MKLHDFRVKNFRSIKDTGWCAFSSDFITVLVGQNESGKTSILAALEKTFNAVDLEDDDVRADASLPSVSIRIETTFDELNGQLGNHTADQLHVLNKYLKGVKDKIEFSVQWTLNHKTGEKRYSEKRNIDDPTLSEALQKAWIATEEIDQKDAREEEKEEEVDDGSDTAQQSNKPIELTSDLVAEAVYLAAPLTLLFDEATGLLPNSIDIETKNGQHELTGPGVTAASNYLEIAGLDLDGLVNGNARVRESMLHRGNQKVTADFAGFWSQTIGKKDKLYLRCDLEFYGANTTKPGRPYLAFWISDGPNHLYPKQRSTGVRWFLSFYLQLKASDQFDPGTLFLLDEPGANLHPRAQTDVLNLINKLSDQKQIMYSTHSPHMVEYDKLYRVLAVQREGEQDDTPTIVIHAHRLGAASRDTLSPILTAMGADFSQQEVIKKHNNVILEEISGFYYLTSFWKLLDESTEANFIAATGANNVETLANMFLGWGLDFIVAVDDDQTGRSVYNSLKRNMFGDNENEAKTRLLKINGKGIEDVFGREDFKNVILGDANVQITGDNSQYVKDAQIAKALLAYQFWIKVSKGNIKLKKLGSETQRKITEVVNAITSRLE